MKFVLGGMTNMFEELPHIIEGAIEADKHGFDTILIPDHYMWGQGNERSSTLESWITLSFLAAKTEKLRLGTLVTPIPFRPPAILAKMISTLDHLSNGRVTLGVGAGWSQSEFEGYSEWSNNKTRVDKTREGLELIMKLWKDDVVDFDGKFYKAKGAQLKPKPVQKPYPKLLFGTNSPRMLKLAGQYANICHLAFPRSNEEYETAKRLLFEAAAKHKRKDEISILYGSMWPSKYDSKDQMKKVEEAKSLGAEYFLASLARDSNFKANVSSFEKDIISSF